MTLSSGTGGVSIGCSVTNEVVVTNTAVAGGVLPPSQVVVPFFTVNEYSSSAVVVAGTTLMKTVDKIELVTVVTFAELEAAASLTIAEPLALTA